MAERAGGPTPGGGRKLTSIYLTLPVLGLVVVVQATLLPRIRLLEASPNALLSVVILWSLLRGVEEGLVWGFIGGLGLDLIAGMPLGTSSLALMSVCFLAALGERNVFLGNLMLLLLIVALATPIYGWIVMLEQQFQGASRAEGPPWVDWASATMYIIGPELALNVLTSLVVYPVLRWLALWASAGQPLM